jgi:hypothetical protein
MLETGSGLEPALKPAVGQYQVAAATPGAALAGQNRVVAARQGGLILARLHCKYVCHHVPLDGPGVQQLSWFGAVSLFRGRRDCVLGPSPSWIPFQGMSVSRGHGRNFAVGSRGSPARHLPSVSSAPANAGISSALTGPASRHRGPPSLGPWWSSLCPPCLAPKTARVGWHRLLGRTCE